MGTGTNAFQLPKAFLVELTDLHQQVIGGCRDPTKELGDLFAQR
jgi:hypothetical protein